MRIFRGAAAAGLLAVALATPVAAAELRDLRPTVADGQVQVSFTLRGAFDQSLIDRIQSGLPTTFVYDFELLRDRAHWWDAELDSASLEVVAMYNAVSQEYLINFKKNGKLVESRLARTRADLEAAMTKFERVPLFPLDKVENTRLLIKGRAELGSRTLLSFIPVHVTTDWTESRKFRPREP
jgi:hypothetical protein